MMNVMMDWFLDLTLKRLFMSLGIYSLGYLSDYVRSPATLKQSTLGRAYGKRDNRDREMSGLGRLGPDSLAPIYVVSPAEVPDVEQK